ncbi:MAG: adenylyltransferase/cytidyltransferase family protein [Planctomycetota bacterium]
MAAVTHAQAPYDLDDLAEVARLHRAAGRRVVVCHGCFDLLHVGHLRYLEAARKQGDVLLVTVTPDGLVNKGTDRPVFPAEQRAEMLAALRAVDGVAINRWPTAVEMLNLIQPDAYAKGAEYAEDANDPASPVGRERAAAEAHGGRLVLIETPKFSSTAILRQITSDR